MRLFFVMLCLLFVNGCGILQSSKDPQWIKQARLEGRDPVHIYSCGPIAIQKAFKRLGIEVSEEDISLEIQSNGTCLRDFLSIFDREARQITFTSEMRLALEKYNYKMIKINSLQEMNEDKDTAILLVRKKNTLEYHWICYPVDRFHFYGKKTVLDSVYLVKKNI
jgi:hypothetical protein